MYLQFSELKQFSQIVLVSLSLALIEGSRYFIFSQISVRLLIGTLWYVDNY